jgi:hypothetical protein
MQAATTHYDEHQRTYKDLAGQACMWLLETYIHIANDIQQELAHHASVVIITSSWVEGPEVVVLTRPDVSKVHSSATVSPGISVLASVGME